MSIGTERKRFLGISQSKVNFLEGRNAHLFITSKAMSFVTTLVLIAVIFRQMAQAKIKLPSMRPIAGLDALTTVVGRATEMGKPVHYSTGRGALHDEFAPQTMAGLNILSHVAKLTAEYDCKLIDTVMQPLVFPVAQELVKQGFLDAGRPEAFRDDIVRFISPEQCSYAAGTMAIMKREQIAGNILIGAFYAEALMLAETGASVGAIQIGGTARMYQLPFFAITCDYVLIGEEMFAAGAYISKDPVALGCIRAQDLGKIVWWHL